MSDFFTTELSNPEFEFNGLRWMTVKSNALRKRVDVTIYVPPQLPPGSIIDMVILLHGVYGSHWAWSFSAGVHHTAGRMINGGVLRPMVLVMPSDGLYGDGSGYLPHQSEDYEKWIVEDLILAVREQIACVGKESRVFITGLSMGGYGSMRLGSKYPGIFKSFSGHSSITEFSQLVLFLENNDDRELSKRVRSKESVIECMLANKKTLPLFRFDCGSEDTLIEYNRKLHRQLEEHHIPHRYVEYPGGHEWTYWQKHIEDSLLFFNGF